MRTMIRNPLAAAIMCMSLTGCGALGSAALAALDAFATADQVATTVGHAIDVAEGGAATYFARHPSEREHEVARAVQTARTALIAYDAVVAAKEGRKDATDKLRAAYDALRDLLASYGITTATPPAGGAETEAPLPEPFELPTGEALLGS